MKKRRSVAVGVTSQNGKTAVKYSSSPKSSAVAVKAGPKKGNLKKKNTELIW